MFTCTKAITVSLGSSYMYYFNEMGLQLLYCYFLSEFLVLGCWVFFFEFFFQIL